MAVATVQDSYLARFEALARQRSGVDPAWLTAVRAQASERFAELGFPTPRDEEWKFTNVAPIANGQFDEASPVTTGPEAIAPYSPALGGVRLVFVNGCFAPDLSDQGTPAAGGLRVASLADALATSPALIEPLLAKGVRFDRHAFAALNTAFLTDGAFVHVPADLAVDEPIHILYYCTSRTPVVVHPRTLIAVSRGASARVVESYAGAADERYFTNAVTEIVGGAGSRLEHIRVQRESFAAYHVASTHIQLDRDAVFVQQSVTLGGALVRNDITATLDASGIEATLNGLYLGDGARLIDNHTTIDHAKPHCASHELYKGMLDGRSRGVFNGKIFVRPDAQKTDAKQTNQVLLLSDDATINTKPQLEIFADDVKCTHGATVGQLDAEALFYLRARGIGEAEARAVLVHAFAGDIIDRVSMEPLRVQLEQALNAQLPKEAQL